jgi:molybdate transport system regulatory protein
MKSPPSRDKPAAVSSRELKLRVYAQDVIAMGPGKADLLAAIDRAGSISAAGRELGMSYRRCWELVSIMNAHFRDPLVLSIKGAYSSDIAQWSAAQQKPSRPTSNISGHSCARKPLTLVRMTPLYFSICL